MEEANPTTFLSLLCNPLIILSKCGPTSPFHNPVTSEKGIFKFSLPHFNYVVDLYSAQIGIPMAGDSTEVLDGHAQLATGSQHSLATVWARFLFSCSCTSATRILKVRVRQRLPGHNRKRKTMQHVYFQSLTKPNSLTTAI